MQPRHTGEFYVLRAGDNITYIRHNGSYTDNILLARKFDSKASAKFQAETMNQGLTKEEIAAGGFIPVELILEEVL